MKKLLITGAYGLVGSNICKILERDYPEIEITKIKFDITNSELLDQDHDIDGVEPFDYIIHAAGYGQPQMFSKDKLSCIQINTKTTDDLFSILNKDGKFLFISTSEVYSGAPSPHKETDIGTTTPQHPRACYIEGKRCGEAICMAYKEQGYDVKIARLALAYGPGTKKGDTRVLNQFIEQSLTKNYIQLKDDGSAKRTYIYVEDAAQIMLDIIFKGKDIVYNVGGISETTIADLAIEISKILKLPTISLGDTNLVGSPDDVCLDLGKIISEFEPSFVTLEEGLKRTINYQKTLYA